MSNDYSVCVTALYYQKRYYIIDVFRGRLQFMALRDKVAELARRYKAARLLIEDAASGMQLLQILGEAVPEGVPRPIRCKSTTDKTTRLDAQASRIQAGDVFIPRSAAWLGEFLSEVTGFPNARFDDQVDALTQMLANSPRSQIFCSDAKPILFGGFDDDGFDHSGEPFKGNPWLV